MIESTTLHRYNSAAKSYYEVKGWYYREVGGRVLKYTSVSVKLVTGKTHQIRVHMKLLGEQLKAQGSFFFNTSFLFLYFSSSILVFHMRGR